MKVNDIYEVLSFNNETQRIIVEVGDTITVSGEGVDLETWEWTKFTKSGKVTRISEGCLWIDTCEYSIGFHEINEITKEVDND